MKNYISVQNYDGSNIRIQPLWANAAKSTAGAVAVLAVFVPYGTIIGAVIGIFATIFDSVQSGKNEANAAKISKNKSYAKDLFYRNIDSQLKSIDTTYQNYANYIDNRYGPLTTKLPMASDGMEITKNLSTYAANVLEADVKYENQIAEASINIKKLKSIKKKVDDIVAGARARRNAKIATMKRNSPGGVVNFCPGIDQGDSGVGQLCTGDCLLGGGGGSAL
jgi:gas vesicle protein